MELLNKFKDSIKTLFQKQSPTPPFEYDFLMELKKSDYKKYIKICYEFNTHKSLDWNNINTLSEKIQWLKLYDTPPLENNFNG